MPLSAHTQALVAAVGIDLTAEQSATDEAAIQAVTAEIAPFEAKFKEQAKTVTQLSADVETLTGKLTAAESERDTKAREVLTLSATAPRPADPLVVEQFTELADRQWEAAVAAGFPAKAVDAIRPHLRGTDGLMNVLALSAAPQRAADGKTRAGRFEPALADWARRVAAGEFGAGVATGVQPAGKVTAQLSADGRDGVTTLAEAAVAAAKATMASTYPVATTK